MSLRLWHVRPARPFRTSTRLAVVSMLFAVGLSLIDTIWGVYLFNLFGKSSTVGLISGIFTVIAVLFSFISPTIIERLSEVKLWFTTAIITAVGYGSIAFIDSIIPFLIIALVITLAAVLRGQVFGILVRDSCNDKELGKVEGLLFSVDNIGWLVGPLIGGFVLAKFSTSPVFLIATAFMLIGIANFRSIRLRDIDHGTASDGSILGIIRNTKEFFHSPRRVLIYLLTGGISFYWAIIYIYVPLLILKSSLPDYYIGLFLFAVAIPLIILEYFVGKAADTKGFRIFFVGGYLILAVASLISFAYFNIAVLLIVLTLGSIGAACLESTVETYFFKITNKSQEERFYGPYVTSYKVFSSISHFLAAGVIIILSERYIFLSLGLAMLVLALLSLRLSEPSEATP